MKEVYYVGLDVHKDSIQMAVLDNRNEPPRRKRGVSCKRYRIDEARSGKEII